MAQLKRCPTCNRTYADESLAFCLADGALLSAPYDPQATNELPPARFTDPPPTEVMPKPVPAPTQAAKAPAPPPATVASPPAPNEPAPPVISRPLPQRDRGRLPLIMFGGVIVLAVCATIIYVALRRGKDNASPNKETSATATTQSPTETPAATRTEAATAKELPPNPNEGRAESRPTPVSGNAPRAASTATPEKSTNTGLNEIKKPEALDYKKIFSQSEVDQRATILSKPTPSYTEEARKNQVAGTVVLRVVLAASGEVTGIVAVSGLPDGLTERAIAAAKQIRFSTAIKDGHTVSVAVQIQYTFNLY